jgi:radical SAM superfamily enzyme YgiQ (UPF0313 family)
MKENPILGFQKFQVSERILKILLVYPRYPDTFWSFRHALKFISKKAPSPPLGLVTVAAMLPRAWKQRLVDLNVDKLTDEDIRWADYIFISSMAIQEKSTKETLRRIKAFNKKIVAGGPLFTLSSDRFPDIDHLVLREAEATLPPFIEDLKRGEAKPVYTSTEWPDVTASPTPEWDLVDIHQYASMSIQYARGCPFDCDFCDISLLNGRKPRTKTNAQILEELDVLYQKGWRGTISFVDDNFIGKPRKLKEELLPALIPWMEKRRYPFSFFTEASINLADDTELMDLMARAGFTSVFVGIESPEEESLAESGKVQNTRRDLMAAVRRMQKFGLHVMGGFIVGFDNDPPSIFQKQVDFIQKSGIVAAHVSILNAPRGTRLYKRLHTEGRLLQDITGNSTDFSINFIPKMGYRRLFDGYGYLVTQIYSPRNFYNRVITFLRNYPTPRAKTYPLQFNYVKAFFHSIWALGISGKERFHYWKALLWTLFSRPQLLPLYMALAIYGYHFRKLFEGELRESKTYNLALLKSRQPIASREPTSGRPLVVNR